MRVFILVALALAPFCQEDPPKKPVPLPVPDAWESREEQGARIITPKNLGEGKVYTVLVPALAGRIGSLKGLVDAGKEQLGAIATFKPAKEPVRAKNDAGWEFDVVIGTLEKDGASLIAQIVALQKGNEEVLILLITDSAETCEKYGDDFAAMIKSLGGAKEQLKFDVWRVPVPTGWTKTETAESVQLARGDGKEFCQFALFKSRAHGHRTPEEDFAQEWKEVLSSLFAPGEMKKLNDRRLRSGVVLQGAVADTRDKKDNAGHTALYVLAPYGRVTSVIVHANSAASFAKHEAAIGELLESLKLDVNAVAALVAAQAGGVGKAEDAMGKWAWSKSGNFDSTYLGLHHGSSVGQYDFKKDGTFTFHLEAWGGSYRSDEYYLVDESGTYVIEGNTIAVRPTAGTSVVKNKAGDILKKGEPTLQHVTYLWQRYHFEGIRDNQLVLTPPGLTHRDGLFAVNALFSRSYLLSAKYDPQWTKFGK